MRTKQPALKMYSRPTTTIKFALLPLLVVSGMLATNARLFADTFTTPGNATWTCPSNVFSVQVEATGGGGGGGGCLNSSGVSAYECAGGGAGGSYVRYTVGVTPGTVYNLTVGAGGGYGTNPPSSTWTGSTGVSSFFGNTTAGSSSGASVLAVGGPGGSGGYNQVGGNSTRIGNIAGGTGTSSGNIPSSSAQSTYLNYAGTTGGTSVGGASGTAHSGAGGAGAGAAGSAGGGAGGAAVVTSGSSTPGVAGTGPGGGGSGAANLTLSKGGGSGAAGQVILTYSASVPSATNSTVAASPTTLPADGVTTSTITVALMDTNGHAIYGKTVTLGSSRGASDTISPVSATSSATGVAAFTVKSTTAGTATLTATDITDSITVTQTANVAFTGGVVIDHFTVTPSTSSTTAGQLFTATVQAYSTPSSPITGNSVDGLLVVMTSSGAAQFDANGDGTYGDNAKALTNGTFTINVTDLKAESMTITAASGTNVNTSASVTVNPGAVAQLQLILPGETATPGVAPGFTGSPATRTAGVGYTVTVNAVDTNYNVASSSDTVNLAAGNDANAVLPANTALSGGTATLSVTNMLAGSGRTLTASDVSNGGITPATSAGYVVVPGAAAQLVLLAPGESPTFGSSPGKTGSPSAQHSTIGYTVTADALDAGYNLVTNCSDTVHISSSAGGDTLPANAALAGGTKTFAVTNNTVGTTTLTAGDTSVGGVTAGSTTVSVDINSTTTALASSVNPAYAGLPITFTATVSGAGLKTGTVTFKNGAAVIATTTLAGSTATLTISGGAGTDSITATYNGDANNSSSTSSAVSQVIQTGGQVAGAAELMEEGWPYSPTNDGQTSSFNGVWTRDATGTSSNVRIVNPGLALSGMPDLPGTNALTLGASTTIRWIYRNLSNSIAGGSVYASFLINNITNVSTTTPGPYVALNTNGATLYAKTDTAPLDVWIKQGADSSHDVIGVAKLGSTPVYSTVQLITNSTHLVVVKYTYGGSNAVLYVDPVPGSSESANAGVSVSAASASADPANIGAMIFGNGGEATTGPDLTYDNVRVSTNWANVTPATYSLGAAALSFTPGPQTLTVNSNSAPIAVTLLDASNNTLTATANTIINLSSTSGGATFLAADDATVVSSVVISNGTSAATFYYRDSIAGSPTITGASGLLTPATQVEIVNPPAGLLDHFSVIPSTASASAGAIFTATVQAYDSNNVAIVDSSLDGQIVTLSSSGLAQFDANGDGTYGDNLKMLTNGVLTINVRDLKAESVTITAALGTPSGTSSAVTIIPDAAAQLQILLPGETATPGVAPGLTGSPPAATAGTGFSIIVNAVDTNWNVAASSDTVSLTAANDANAILPANTALVAGTKTLSVTNIIAGSGRTLTATDVSNGGITASTSPAYSVTAGAVAQLVLMAPGESPTYGAAPGKTGTPSPQVQTAPFTLTVNALDAYDNLANTAGDTVHISSSDGGATVIANTALSAGVTTFSITQNALGSVTDTASDVSNGGVTSGTTTLTENAIPRYRSVASGNWGDTSTWQYSTDGGSTWNPATGTPSSTTAALVLVTNATVTVNSDVSINRTTVAANGSVSVLSGVKLSVVAATATDLDVFGIITNAGVVTNIAPATTVMESGATYYHNQDGGSLLIASWNVNSTCDVIGWTTATADSSATGVKQKFGNLTWNNPAETGIMSFGSSTLTNVAGNFNVLSTGSGALALCIGSDVNLKIGGDLNVVSGATFYASTASVSGFTEVVNIGGNVNITNGTVSLETGTNGSEIVTWNLSGDLNISGGTFTAADTSNRPLINFVKSGTQKIALSNGGTMTSSNTLNWAVNSGSTLDLGANIITGTGSFTVNAGGGLITAYASGIRGNLGLTNSISLSSGANYTYNGVSLQSGDTLLPAAVAGLTVNNNIGLVLNQATTATNMALIASTVTGNLTVPSTGAMVVSGGGCSVTGNVNLNAGSLTLVSSNNFPQLTIVGGTASLNGGNLALTVLGAPIAEGTYLLVDTASGGTVGGTLPALVNLSGTALPSWSTGIPQITGGKLYVYYQKFFSAVDNGPGFFSGENLQHEDVSGRTFYVWSTSDLTQPVSNWTLEGPAVEFPISGSSPAMSQYGITVTPTASPMYYVVATTNGGPFLATEPLITLTTSDYVSFDVGATNTAITSGGVFELVPPVIVPVTINPASARLSGGAMAFAFTNATGLTFTILATNDLTAPVTNWPAIGTAVERPSGSGSYQFTDPAAATNLQRFYLLRQP
ncbi:MAG TPA: Ig-like domain repeat protein [Candidatus Sulfotelmatobacter sp.]|jgi:hypothetical protein|nr:Ig-like domain repeat protein [Candidatus Sulfotelmatobacter sp.]